MNRTSPGYCTEFPEQYKNASIMSFDTNFGDSFGDNLDIFAIKTLSPYNSVKVYQYDYIQEELTEIYEIPIFDDKIE
jgi:hypothetical protein